MKLKDLFLQRRLARRQMLEVNIALVQENHALRRELDNFKKYHYRLFLVDTHPCPQDYNVIRAELQLHRRTLNLIKDPQALVYDIARQLWLKLSNSNAK